MKLYVFNGSPNARKTLAAANYLDLDIEVVWKDVTRGDLSQDGFLEINPNGKVPVLQDGDVSIWESNAILVYLSTLGGGELFPNRPQDRAMVLSWLFWETNHFNRAVGMYVWETVLKPTFGLGETDDTQLARARVMLSQVAPVLENRLEQNDFVMGEALSIVDFALGCFSAFLEPAKVPITQYPAISNWYQRLDSIPAWRMSAPDLTRPGRGGAIMERPERP